MIPFMVGFFSGVYAQQTYDLPNLSQCLKQVKLILKDLEKPPSK